MFKHLIIIGICGIVLSISTTLVYHTTQQADINYFQGHRFFLKGEYNKAIPFYVTALEVSPAKTDALRELAYSYLWTDRPQKAIKLFQQLISKDPEDHKTKGSLAEALSWRKQYPEAIALYKDVILSTDDIKAKEKLAQVYLWSGQLDKAKELLTEVLKKHPDDFEARMLWGRALYYSGESKKASEIFEQLLKEEQEKKQK